MPPAVIALWNHRNPCKIWLNTVKWFLLLKVDSKPTKYIILVLINFQYAIKVYLKSNSCSFSRGGESLGREACTVIESETIWGRPSITPTLPHTTSSTKFHHFLPYHSFLLALKVQNLTSLFLVFKAGAITASAYGNCFGSHAVNVNAPICFCTLKSILNGTWKEYSTIVDFVVAVGAPVL